MRRTGVHGTLIVMIGGSGGNGPRTLAAVAGKGALAAMAHGFAESLAANHSKCSASRSTTSSRCQRAAD